MFADHAIRKYHEGLKVSLFINKIEEANITENSDIAKLMQKLTFSMEKGTVTVAEATNMIKSRKFRAIAEI